MSSISYAHNFLDHLLDHLPDYLLDHLSRVLRFNKRVRPASLLRVRHTIEWQKRITDILANLGTHCWGEVGAFRHLQVYKS